MMMPRYRWLRTALPALLGFAILAESAESQSTQPRLPGERSRAQMEARARQADSLQRRDEAFHLRTRLREGDFEIGDRIVVSYDGVGLQRGDTLVVQAGKIVRLGEPMGDLPLQGLLRSEVADSVAGRVSRYFKNIVIRVTPLLRLSITGAVRAPGFYYSRSDAPLSDVIMRTAGQDQTSDLGNTVIRRRQQVLWTSEDVRAALRDGLTLDALNLDPGDEIVVGTRNTSQAWTRVAQFGLPVVTALLVQLLIRR